MFKMSWDDASDIFLSPSGYGWPFYSVTPEDVADRAAVEDAMRRTSCFEFRHRRLSTLSGGVKTGNGAA
jgi:hypothetical protein